MLAIRFAGRLGLPYAAFWHCRNDCRFPFSPGQGHITCLSYVQNLY